VSSLEACHEKSLWDLDLAGIRSDVVELESMQAAKHTEYVSINCFRVGLGLEVSA
jgi:hypothetical protein